LIYNYKLGGTSACMCHIPSIIRTKNIEQKESTAPDTTFLGQESCNYHWVFFNSLL